MISKKIFKFTVTRRSQKHLLEFDQPTVVLYSTSLSSKDRKVKI